MHRQTLECRDIVLRGLTRASHIDRQTNSVLTAAFLLRTFQDKVKEEALSVSYDCSPEECAANFNPCYGIVSLHVGRVRNLGLDVVPDEPHHANIKGLPHPDDNVAEAERFAGQLQRQARLVWQRS